MSFHFSRSPRLPAKARNDTGQDICNKALGSRTLPLATGLPSVIYGSSTMRAWYRLRGLLRVGCRLKWTPIEIEAETRSFSVLRYVD